MRASKCGRLLGFCTGERKALELGSSNEGEARFENLRALPLSRFSMA